MLTEEVMPKGDYGVVRFMPEKIYQSRGWGLGRDAGNELLKEAVLAMLTNTPQRPQSVGDWPKVNEALLRGDMFVIETGTRGSGAMLHFCPERPDAGHYEIRRPDCPVEKGRTTLVEIVGDEVASGQLSALAPFSYRYLITTEKSDPARTTRKGLVRPTSYRTPDETEHEDDAES